MSVIARCPDCGWPIYDGHVSHRCPTPPVVLEEAPAFVATFAFGPIDLIVVPPSTPPATEEP